MTELATDAEVEEWPELPIPPSTNQLYRNVHKHGRVKTTQYKSWLKEALWVLKSGLPVLTPPVKLGITIYGGKGFSQASDISNRMKAVEDALVSTGRLEDDNVRFVIECRQRYFFPEKGDHARCVLSVVDSDE